MKHILFVSGLSPLTRSKDLAEIFKIYGPLVRCDIPFSKGVARGYGFVEFSQGRDASIALGKMQNKVIDGRYIKVERAKYQSDASEYPWRIPFEQQLALAKEEKYSSTVNKRYSGPLNSQPRYERVSSTPYTRRYNYDRNYVRYNNSPPRNRSPIYEDPPQYHYRQ